MNNPQLFAKLRLVVYGLAPWKHIPFVCASMIYRAGYGLGCSGNICIQYVFLLVWKKQTGPDPHGHQIVAITRHRNVCPDPCGHEG